MTRRITYPKMIPYQAQIRAQQYQQSAPNLYLCPDCVLLTNFNSKLSTRGLLYLFFITDFPLQIVSICHRRPGFYGSSSLLSPTRSHVPQASSHIRYTIFLLAFSPLMVQHNVIIATWSPVVISLSCCYCLEFPLGHWSVMIGFHHRHNMSPAIQGRGYVIFDYLIIMLWMQ